MKKIIFFVLISLFASLAFGQSLMQRSDYNPDGKIGSTILTFLVGFHVGDKEISYVSKQNLRVRGFWSSVSAKYPISKSFTFLLNLDYDRISVIPNPSRGIRNSSETLDIQKWKTTQSLLNLGGGIRFFISGK